MPFKWSEDLAIGVDQIDEQHKELINRVNNLLDAMKEGTGKLEIEGMVGYLEKYVIFHFEDEEKFMASFNYPGLSKQKKAHKEFKNIMEDIRANLNENGVTTSIMVEFQNKVCQWIINHVTGLDKIMCGYYKDHQK